MPTPNKRRLDSTHTVATATRTTDIDINKRHVLDDHLKVELDDAWITEWELPAPKLGTTGLNAVRALLIQMDQHAYRPGYERDFAVFLNDYLEKVDKSCPFRFVYLDRPLNANKIRPDIVVVHCSCLTSEAQKMRENVRREHKLKIDPKARRFTINSSTLVQVEESTDDEVPSPAPGSENVAHAIKAKSVPTPATRSSQRLIERTLNNEMEKFQRQKTLSKEVIPKSSMTQPVIFYSDITAFVELTYGSKTSMEEIIQVAGYVREVRFAQPMRRGIPCLFLNKSPSSAKGSEEGWHFRLVSFDPSGYRHSGKHQHCTVTKDQFVYALNLLTINHRFSPDDMLKFPCEREDEQLAPKTVKLARAVEAKFVRFLMVHRNLLGRCTVVYIVEHLTMHVVVKESWPDINRINEAEFLAIAARRQVSDMATLHPNFTGRDAKDFVVTNTSELRQLSDLPSWGCRRLVRIPLDKLGDPIQEARNPLEIVGIMDCAIRAIHGLTKPSHEKAINHRDISLSNLLFTSPRDGDSNRIAFLTDLDNADYYVPGYTEERDTSTHLHLTGTLLYMAIDTLEFRKEFRHLPRLDYESILYVGLVLASMELDQTLPSPFTDWISEVDMGLIAAAKYRFLQKNRFKDTIQPQHQVLTPYFTEMARVILNTDDSFKHSQEDQCRCDEEIFQSLTAILSNAHMELTRMATV